MTAEKSDNTLQAFRDRTPFRPFTVVLHSGREFEVDHPGKWCSGTEWRSSLVPAGCRLCLTTRVSSISQAIWPTGRRPDRPCPPAWCSPSAGHHADGFTSACES